ncbi:Holliday junction branch migration protein RuvA [Peptoniphilus sp. KCTC 25270]|uniref:Holliday junction branch migration protein RuvA n=1 Tax=Peptoniphilus sp. KCTC 25270 TaxID=2897414 RepID=UPI001E50754D|nr:Holliday junction branch migration protein RuvA [Peptoniphilus sp. KCTC 25270]MCD1147047.1 Holliday junction branch migration protein RuvA [Peptoniphilus sp. KCTC 25270]
MFDFIQGNIEDIDLQRCVLLVNGVGYSISISDFTRREIMHLKETRLYIHMQVKETEILLFGFYTLEERKVFELLTSVSGIGPKVALSMLSQFSIGAIAKAIALEDAKTIQKTPGVGKKTAERVILELKDKIGALDLAFDEEMGPLDTEIQGGNEVQEVKEALILLGYREIEINDALRRIDVNQPLESMLKDALKQLAKNQ